MNPAPTDESRQRAAAALLEFMRSPENSLKWRILERLSQAAGLTVEIHYLNLSISIETTRLLGPKTPLSS